MKFSRIKVTRRGGWIGDNRVYDPVITYEGKSLICGDNVPVSITRLIPAAWANAAERDWRPLVERAIVLGLL